MSRSGCKCTMAKSLTGDGCRYCQPQTYITFLERQAIDDREDMERMEADAARTICDPVAWQTFDGEGGYEYRSYVDNEGYLKWWENTHPKHKGWVQPLYTALPDVPDGWMLVPVAPTAEMLKAADVAQGPEDHYCAMLSAVPKP